MTGSLLPTVVNRAVDSAGKPLAGALLYTYLTGTTTPAATYNTPLLSAPLTNPVIADIGGLFPEIFLDPNVTYRFQLKTSGGVLVQDVDPYTAAAQIPDGSIAGTKLIAGGVQVALGFAPANRAGDQFVGELRIGYNLSTPMDARSVGFRGAPAIVRNANYQFAADDAGQLQIKNDTGVYTWTIPNDATLNFPIGTIIPFRSSNSGIVTLARMAGVTQTIAGSGTNKDVAVAQWGFGAITKEAANGWICSGVNLS